MLAGDIFCLYKSCVMHFSRNKKKLSVLKRDSSLVLRRAAIKLSSRLNLLRVMLAQRLQYREHIDDAIKKEVLATLVLQRQKNMRSNNVKLFFNSKVILVTDYTKSALSLFAQVQKIGHQAIMRVFQTVSMSVEESEASIVSPECQFLILQITT